MLKWKSVVIFIKNLLASNPRDTDALVVFHAGCEWGVLPSVCLVLVFVYLIPNVYNHCQTVTEMDDRSCSFHRVLDWEKKSGFDPSRSIC